MFTKFKQEFKRATSWNKYRPEIATLPKNNILDYLIDPTFKNINTLCTHFKILQDIIFISITCP